MEIKNRPLIGIILDEDTSNGGKFYQTNKGYFDAIYNAGGAPIGLSYHESSIEFAVKNCAGLLSTGARIRFDDEFYIDGEHSHSPVSPRFEFEKRLIELFVAQDRPYFGICNGMQLLGALHGAKMTYRIAHHLDGSIAHDNGETRHLVNIDENSKLFSIIGEKTIVTNSHHSEGILQTPANINIDARAIDGTIEAISIKNKKCAIGVQWHPELLWPNPKTKADINYGDVSRKLFEFFVNCAKSDVNSLENPQSN